MQQALSKLTAAGATQLKAFLDSPDRPKGTLRFHELQGFLFAVASSPEVVMPSEWMPLIGDDKGLGFRDEAEAEHILGSIMALYNEINTKVIHHSRRLPRDCRFRKNVLANLEVETSICQWSRGFTMGHNWLEESWDAYLPDSKREELGPLLMVLSFFGSRQMAEAFYDELDMKETGTTFEQFAKYLRELFPDALSEYASTGRSLFEASLLQPEMEQPVRSVRIGRNEPCPCGSGKKYKKCCGKSLH